VERISRGFRLIGASWQVLKADRELLVLPVISFIATALVAGSFFLAAWGIGLPAEGENPQILHYVLMALFYFTASFIAIFCNAAIVGAATIRLKGGDPTVSDGIRLARARVGKIAGWAALTASVGLVLRALEERAGFLGRIVIAIVGAAWSAVTFFVVPVLLYEELGTVDSVKRSAQIFKSRWGEQFTGNVSIGLAMLIIGIPLFGVVALLAVVAWPLALLVGIAGFGLLGAAGSALTGIFNAALYRFATTGEVGGAFTEDDLRGAFRAKRGASTPDTFRTPNPF
jgi:hypothetical protein